MAESEFPFIIDLERNFHGRISMLPGHIHYSGTAAVAWCISHSLRLSDESASIAGPAESRPQLPADARPGSVSRRENTVATSSSGKRRVSRNWRSEALSRPSSTARAYWTIATSGRCSTVTVIGLAISARSCAIFLSSPRRSSSFSSLATREAKRRLNLGGTWRLISRPLIIGRNAAIEIERPLIWRCGPGSHCPADELVTVRNTPRRQRCAGHRRLFLVTASRAEVCPVDVRTKVFTGNRAASGLLDRWAVFGWNVFSGHPVMDNLRDNQKFPRKRCLGPYNLNCSFQRIHSHIINTWGMLCQRVVFAQVNICCRLAAWP